MKTISFFFACLVFLFGCGPASVQVPADFPAQWIIVNGEGEDWTIYEGPWGEGLIELKMDSTGIKSILVAEGGGAEEFEIVQTKSTERGYTFVSTASSGQEIQFEWINQAKGLAKWTLYYGEFTTVSSIVKHLYPLVPYEEEEPADEIPTDQYVLIDASFHPELSWLTFLHKSSGQSINFNIEHHQGLGKLDPETNDFFFAQEDPEGGIFPIYVPKASALYQSYVLTIREEVVDAVLNEGKDTISVLDAYEKLDLYSKQEHATRLLLSRLPLEAFDYVTDDVTAEHVQQALAFHPGREWNLLTESDRSLILRHREGFSSAKIVVYPAQEEGTDLVAVYTENEQASTLTFWMELDPYPTDILSLPNKEALRLELTTQDFFDDPVTEEVPLIYVLEKDLSISVSPHTWMNPAFEDIEVKRHYKLTWNGSSFESAVVEQ